jgi:ComF family protein
MVMSSLMTTLLPRLGQVLRLFLDMLIPPRCPSCGAITSEQGALCADCWQHLRFLGPPHCACCGQPFPLDVGAEARCPRCLTRPPRFDRARAVFRYDEASRPLILRFKHADRIAVARPFARWMARAGGALLAEADLLVPVPLHPWRLFRRRYNQAALLALELSRLSGVPVWPDALRRIRATPPQGRLSGRARHRNVRGAFRLRQPQAVAGRRILLIDDVMTTGATLEECARLLRMGGASGVDVLTLARVVLGESGG